MGDQNSRVNHWLKLGICREYPAKVFQYFTSYCLLYSIPQNRELQNKEDDNVSRVYATDLVEENISFEPTQKRKCCNF